MSQADDVGGRALGFFVFFDSYEESAVVCSIVLRHLNMTRSRPLLSADATPGSPESEESGLRGPSTESPTLCLSYCDNTETHTQGDMNAQTA